MTEKGKPVIIVSGKDGQLGSELMEISTAYPGYRFYFFSKGEMDIADPAAISHVFETLSPAYFINTAAYTAVDKAETDKTLAYVINAEAVGALAAKCRESGTMLIHISTDYVFNGRSRSPYRESDHTEPLNYYGFSKLRGEQLALQNNPATVIIRTSWVYSQYGRNFVKTMLHLMDQRSDINVVDDQIGSPTYARDIAEAVLAIIERSSAEKPPGGIYHFSNEGAISWYDFALSIKEIKQRTCNVHPIPTSDYPTPATRPRYTVMNKEKIVSTFGIVLKDWRESLRSCLEKL